LPWVADLTVRAGLAPGSLLPSRFAIVARRRSERTVAACHLAPVRIAVESAQSPRGVSCRGDVHPTRGITILLSGDARIDHAADSALAGRVKTIQLGRGEVGSQALSRVVTSPARGSNKRYNLLPGAVLLCFTLLLPRLAEDASIDPIADVAGVEDPCASPHASTIGGAVHAHVGVAVVALVVRAVPVWHTSAVYARRSIPITDFTEIIRFVPAPHAGAVLLAPSGEHDKR
jgi:hypothetical protein